MVETVPFLRLRRRRTPADREARINLIDFDHLRLHTPEVVNDLPADGKRLAQSRRLRGAPGRRHPRLRAPRAHRCQTPEGSCAAAGRRPRPILTRERDSGDSCAAPWAPTAFGHSAKSDKSGGIDPKNLGTQVGSQYRGMVELIGKRQHQSDHIIQSAASDILSPGRMGCNAVDPLRHGPGRWP